jgi:hypothetical protein
VRTELPFAITSPARSTTNALPGAPPWVVVSSLSALTSQLIYRTCVLATVACEMRRNRNLWIYYCRMDHQRSRMNGIAHIALSVWIVAAQTWYYFKFLELFRVAARPILRRLWH